MNIHLHLRIYRRTLSTEGNQKAKRGERDDIPIQLERFISLIYDIQNMYWEKVPRFFFSYSPSMEPHNQKFCRIEISKYVFSRSAVQLRMCLLIETPRVIEIQLIIHTKYRLWKHISSITRCQMVQLREVFTKSQQFCRFLFDLATCRFLFYLATYHTWMRKA